MTTARNARSLLALNSIVSIFEGAGKSWSANVSGANFDRVNAILPDTIAIRMDDGTWTFRPAPPDADPALTGLADPMHY